MTGAALLIKLFTKTSKIPLKVEAMIWINVFVIIILFFSFIGGLKEGVVKNIFSLLVLIIAIPLSGLSYHLVSGILSFLPGEGWGNFIGFFITLALISMILQFAILLPGKLAQEIWSKGGLYRLIGGVLNTFKSAIGMVVFTLLIAAYPIIGWLERVVTGSSILTWLVVQLSFVRAMLPGIFHDAVVTVMNGTLLCLGFQVHKLASVLS